MLLSVASVYLFVYVVAAVSQNKVDIHNRDTAFLINFYSLLGGDVMDEISITEQCYFTKSHSILCCIVPVTNRTVNTMKINASPLNAIFASVRSKIKHTHTISCIFHSR